MRVVVAVPLSVAFILVSIGAAGTIEAFAAEGNLLSPVGASQLQTLTSEQKELMAQIKKRPTTVTVTPVLVNIAALRMDSTTMSLQNGTRLLFVGHTIEERGPDDFSWSAWSTGAGNSPSIVQSELMPAEIVRDGVATLVVRKGNVTATIWEDGQLYQLEPIQEKGIHALIQMDETRFPDEHPSSSTGGSEAAGQVPKNTSVIPSVAVQIKVLVGYTPAARAAVGDIVGKIQLAIDETNASYQRSAVMIKLILVDTVQVSYSEKDKTYETILSEVASDGSLVFQRYYRSAHLVAIVIDKPDKCGLAKTILANVSNAFAVVHHNCAASHYSLAHELGHLQGARHDPGHDISSSPFAYGHGFQSGSAWRTIMAYDCATPCPRLGYWSNPNIFFYGLAMGTSGQSNNSRVLNETAASIAAFKPPSPSAALPAPANLRNSLEP